ncbi:copper transporter [Monashia sp. NPDC004114]
MIDFRYHLVSIISIFLALAVGIVLGAGPLQSSLGDQLSDQVAALRTEKQTLNDQLTSTEKLVDASDDYSRAVQERVVEGRLSGHRAVVVALPASDGSIAKSVEEVLSQSGASYAGTVTLSSDWFDPSQAADRDRAAHEAATALGIESGTTGDALLAEVLVALTVTQGNASASAQHAAALKVLGDAGLLDSSVPDLVPGDLAVVISGDYAGTQAQVDAQSDAIRTLVTDLAHGSHSTAVVGGEPVAAAGQPASSDAVAAVREKSDTAGLVPTVDHARSGHGPGNVVLAIEAALDEHVGHYGISTGATATVPRVHP